MGFFKKLFIGYFAYAAIFPFVFVIAICIGGYYDSANHPSYKMYPPTNISNLSKADAQCRRENWQGATRVYGMKYDGEVFRCY